jgi:hypothetical protein
VDDRGRADLLEFLAAQRPSALAVVAGLDETAMMRPVVPSGWAPRGMLEHLAGAERYWFQRVLTGRMHVSACEGDGVQGQAVHEETDDGVLRSPSPERRHRRPGAERETTGQLPEPVPRSSKTDQARGAARRRPRPRRGDRLPLCIVMIATSEATKPPC